MAASGREAVCSSQIIPSRHGLACAIHLIEDFIQSPPEWMMTAALWAFAASFTAIVAFTVTHIEL